MIFYYDVIYPLTCRIVLHLVQQLKMGSYLKIDIKYIFQTIKVKKKKKSWKGDKNREKPLYFLKLTRILEECVLCNNRPFRFYLQLYGTRFTIKRWCFVYRHTQHILFTVS